MPLYEYECRQCGDFEAQARLADRRTQPCPGCGELANKVIKTPPTTDVLGSEHYDDVNEVRYTSTREYEKKMAVDGWTPSGDKVGGARNEHRHNGTIFSYAGQSSRTSATQAGNQ